MIPRSLRVPLLLCASAVSSLAQAPAAPKPPIVNDPALRIELLATVPEIEAPTTVCGAPDGSIYVGNDPRDGRLSNKEPVNTIVRFSAVTTGSTGGTGKEETDSSNPREPRAPRGSRKRTVFADKIYSPAGSAWHDGWLYVIHDPLMTRFKDTDGDGVADVREDLVTNLGIPPNEGLNDHVVSGFTLGMDGFWYISVGDRGIFQAKSVKDGSTITMQGGGIARCRTDGTQLEVFSTGTRNHLQVNLDAEDNAFTRDNTDDGNGWWTRLTHHIEGGYYGYPYDYRKAPNYGVTQPSEQTINAMKQHGGSVAVPEKAPPSRQGAKEEGESTKQTPPWRPGALAVNTELFLPAMADFGGGSPTGGLCYLSDGLPEQYRGKHFFSEWGKAGIFVTEVARDGATFKLVSDTKLIEPEKGGDFRPMQLSVAADGSLLIADWGYGGWKSPKVAGAIWRLYWPEAKPAPRLKDESKATVEELLAALGHPDRDQRLRAQESLVQRGVAAMPDTEVYNRLADLTLGKGSVTTPQRFHALWALRSLDGRLPKDANWDTLPKHLRRLLEDPDASIRAQVAAISGESVGAAVSVLFRPLGKLAIDSNPDVRRRAVITLGKLFHEQGDVGLLIDRLTDADSWVRFAARKALVEANAWTKINPPHRATNAKQREAIWQALSETGNEQALQLLLQGLSAAEADSGVQAVATLGKVAYQPKPYDGHWWGTQPVKNPPPLNSVPWAGTPQALAALTAALSDPDAGVRLAAAKAFSLFLLSPADATGASARMMAPAGNIMVSAGTFLAPAVADGGKISTVTPEILTADDKKITPDTKKATDNAKKLTADTKKVTADAEKPAVDGKKETVKAEIPPGETTVAGDHRTLSTAARTALRARLTAETDSAVRRQLIEALGVQKDPQAMEVFRQIALGDPDMAFRETAIAAVVSIGGDDAKKTIAQLADAQLSPAATRRIITAAGELKVLEAAPALIAHLKDADAGNRELAARALRQLGPKANEVTTKDAKITKAEEGNASELRALRDLRGANPPVGPASAALIEALADKDGKVAAAAIEALGSYKEKAALPALIALAEKRKFSKETIGALANMPDESAIPVLVETLRDKNTGVRRNAIKALKTMREKAGPQVEALLASGRVPEELVPEIKNAFESGAIVKWKMVGVFENVWEAVHPPEKDALEFSPPRRQVAKGENEISSSRLGDLAVQSDPKFLTRKYHNAEGKDVGWIDVTADSEVGRVDLAQVFKTTAMVCAYAFTEIDAAEAGDAKLFTSVDDEIAVWLNGQQVQNLSGSRGYEPDKYETTLPLKAGKNSLFVKIGNKGGSWVFHARIPGFENGKFVKSKDPTPEEKQRLFALATKPDGSFINPGNAKNGEKLFFDQAAALGGMCVTCHAVGAKGGQIGPALTTVGANYKRADLITSLHEPSKTIALGFEQVMLETTGGETIAGSLRAESAEAFTIVDAAGQSRAVKKTEVKKKTDLHVSLMPPGLTLGLKPADFADLLAYLESLKGQ